MTKRTPQQIGRASRNKGANYERAIARKLRHIYPCVERAIESREGKGYDLENTAPFLIQLKCYAKYAPVGKIEEVPRVEGMIPLLITKGDRKPDVVCLYMTDFIKLVEKLEGKML